MHDKFVTLVTEASFAVAILANADVTDIELMPVTHSTLSDEKVNELARLWAPRGLRWIGAIGVEDGRIISALTEPLDPLRTSAISRAFVAYWEVLLSAAIEQQQAGDSIEWLQRLHSLEDPREA